MGGNPEFYDAGDVPMPPRYKGGGSGEWKVTRNSDAQQKGRLNGGFEDEDAE